MTENYIVMSELLEHIETAKLGDKNISLTDVILDFVEVSDYELQQVSEAISEDNYFKEMLMNDCVSKKIIKSEKNTSKLDEW